LVAPTAAGVDLLKQWRDQYPWTPGTTQDVTKSGCRELSCVDRGVPYLTTIVGGTLRLGDPSHRLCTPDTRRVKLQASGFVRESRRSHRFRARTSGLRLLRLFSYKREHLFFIGVVRFRDQESTQTAATERNPLAIPKQVTHGWPADH